MNLDSTLAKLESGFESRNRALLWLKQAQATGGWREYMTEAARRPLSFQLWINDEEACMLYTLANHLNCTVLNDACCFQNEAAWAAIYGMEIAESDRAPAPMASEAWREKQICLLEDVLILEAVVDRIAQTYFDGQRVLFRDAQADLDTLSATVRDLARLSNLLLKSTKLELIDVEQVKIGIQNGIEERFTLITETARAGVLREQGRRLEAIDVLRAVVTPKESHVTA